VTIKPKIRGLAVKKITKLQLKNSISKQNNNICLLSGRIKGVVSKINFSRHILKKLGSVNLLQNFKINAW